jgi:putative transposase
MQRVRSLIAVLFSFASDLGQFLGSAFQSRTALVAENLFLRKQLAFYREHKVRPRRITDVARLSLVLWSRLFDWKKALLIVKPDTLIGWHRKGFKRFWRWKSCSGRPALPLEIRELIARMARENPTWGQARVAAELSLKLGIFLSPRTVRKYWPWEPSDCRGRRISSQHCCPVKLQGAGCK